MLGSGVRAVVCAALLLATACGTGDSEPSAAKPDKSASASGSPSGSASASASASPSARPVSEDLAVDKPGELTQPLLSSDVLVYSQESLEKETIERIKAIKGVTTVEPISMGSFFADEREVTYAAVDPASFRRFTPPGTAQTAAVWERVAGGEIAIEPKLGRQLQQEDGYLKLGNGDDAKEAHIGAYAQILDPSYARRIDAVVNTRWIEKLGMRRDNAMIVSLGTTSPQSIRKQLQRYAGSKASVQILGPDLDINATQTALLTGGSVAAAVGSFSYTANPDGTVNPDPAWVAANIRTEVMPIIGRVTGHRVMLPQLRAALNEVVSRGLSSKIYTYDGLYVPRFIGHDPSRGLSFHTYGTAIDLNARDNYRGIAGKMDRQVVSIFKKWGFAWGGDWNYTDPMHFELAKLVKVG
jgi:hypothetical protein